MNMRVELWMKISAAVIALLAACGAVYAILVPANTFIIFWRSGGGTVSFSRWRIEFEGPPDHYNTGAFDQIESYVSRLTAPSPKKRFVGIFTSTGDRGFGLDAIDGRIEASFTVEWRQEPQREAAIRAFFR